MRKVCLKLTEVRGEISGVLIGVEICLGESSETVSVFADQDRMPGFRCGVGFVDSLAERSIRGKSIEIARDIYRAVNKGEERGI